MVPYCDKFLQGFIFVRATWSLAFCVDLLLRVSGFQRKFLDLTL